MGSSCFIRLDAVLYASEIDSFEESSLSLKGRFFNKRLSIVSVTVSYYFFSVFYTGFYDVLNRLL